MTALNLSSRKINKENLNQIKRSLNNNKLEQSSQKIK